MKAAKLLMILMTMIPNTYSKQKRNDVVSPDVARLESTVEALSTRLDTLERENQNVTTRMDEMQTYIKTLERQINATDNYAMNIDRRTYMIQNKLNYLNKLIDELDTVLAKTKNKVNGIDNRVERLNDTLVDLVETVARIGESLSEVRGAINTRDAFVAYISDFSILVQNRGVVLFNKILLNHGNGYDPITGKFTCQHTGLYLFSTSIVNYYYWNKLSARIVKNGRTISTSVHGDSYAREWNQGSVTSVTQCRQNEQVWVECSRKSRIHGGSPEEAFTHFTGTLLQIDI